MQARAMRSAVVEDALRGAAERHELVLHYQPEILLRTNAIVGVEALVRWQHPEWGLVQPGEFIPVAEVSNLILELGGWVLSQGLSQCAAWPRSIGPAAPMLAINITARQFLQAYFLAPVSATLALPRAPPGQAC